MRLLIKYFEKNKEMFGEAINFENYFEEMRPLEFILRTKNLNDEERIEWLKILFDLSQRTNVMVDNSTLKNAIKTCKRGIVDSKIGSMIQDYISTNQILLG